MTIAWGLIVVRRSCPGRDGGEYT